MVFSPACSLMPEKKTILSVNPASSVRDKHLVAIMLLYALCSMLSASDFPGSLKRAWHDNIDQVVPLKSCLVKNTPAVRIADSADNHRFATGG